ncbi:glycosyltransferase family 61 protein [Shewanella sp. VB17]|uniref:glycosyltransferase family 61 protein n=1 Tax=Shewanella sp. VB17 TaxID=2739432 RepID=UPI001565E88E|nr:glycosyltransferase family 61 protein [Shewanella sp. VB17]NRD72376.1 glycosyltransferase family 61 protein [Shewanella sp. VB17]
MKQVELKEYIEINDNICFYPSTVDYVRRNLNDSHHVNLNDPDLKVVELNDVYVTPDGFVFNDQYFISDLGYQDVVNKNFKLAQSEITVDTHLTIQQSNLLGGHKNYYHWLINWMPRLFLLEMCGFCQGNLLVNGTLANFQKKTFEYLVIHSNYNLIRMNKVVFVKNLRVPVFFMNPLHSPFAISQLRNRARLDMEISLPRKIFVSRKDAFGRKIINEDVFFGALKEYSYELVKLESLTFQQQIQIFSNATHIVSPHGAGLVNMAFSRNLKSVIEIFNTAWSPVYWSLARIVGVTKYSSYNAIAVDNGLKPQLHDLKIDVGNFMLNFVNEL